MVIITSLFQAWILGRQQKYLPQALIILQGYLAITAADEAKYQENKQKELDGLAEVMQRLKEFEMGNRS
jgi:hypothetical protein